MSDITVEVVAAPAIEVIVTQAGAPGMSAYQHAVANGFVGTEAAWLESLEGDDGDQGPAGTITVGTVTTGAPGTDVEVENVGTASAAVLNFTIPEGQPGEDASGGGGAWGSITGTLTDQTDLSDALDDKSDVGHTHTASDVSDFNTAADARVVAGITGKLDTSAAPELIRDTMGTALVAGTNVTITVNDAGDTITIDASGGGGGAAQEVRHSNDGTYDYTGTAPNGTAEGSSGWTVTRITLTSPPVVMTGSGTWTGRAGLSYS